MAVCCQRFFLRVLASMGVGACIFVFIQISLAHSAVSPSFSIEPTFADSSDTGSEGYFIYTSTPGTRIDDSIHITNTSPLRGSIDLYAVDVTTGQMGGTSVLTYSDPKRDVGAWITLSRSRVTLAPGQSQDVPFTLTVPEHVRPGQHGGAIVAEDTQREQHVRQRQNTSAMKIDIQSVVALGVLINLPGPFVERLSATGIRYDEKSMHQRLLLTLKNTGTQLLHPSGSLQLHDDDGQLLQTVPMMLHTFVPQTAIDYPIDIQHKALIPGKRYTIQLRLTYEHKHSLNYTSAFLVPLPEEGPIIDQIQNLISTPSSDFLSTLTTWHYIFGVVLLFLIISACVFRSKKIRPIMSKIIASIQRHKGKRLQPPTEDERVPVHARSKGEKH